MAINSVPFPYPGTFIWPPGVTECVVECLGEGGKGGGTTGQPAGPSAGGGGKGGSYARKTVIKGTEWELRVEVGRVDYAAETPGHCTYVTQNGVVICSAPGGASAVTAGMGSAPGATGVNGAFVGDIYFEGGNGGTVSQPREGEADTREPFAKGGGGGGAAGPGGAGGHADRAYGGLGNTTSAWVGAGYTSGNGADGAAPNAAGLPGKQWGGAGSGANSYVETGSRGGGRGYAGFVLISYTTAPYPPYPNKAMVTQTGSSTVYWPAGVIGARIQALGGGGSGGYPAGGGGTCGGGKGGSFAEATITRGPEASLTVVVGKGGTEGISQSHGEASFVTQNGVTVVSAPGGPGAVNYTGNPATSYGASGLMTAPVGQFFEGGNGGTPVNHALSGGGGGAAGPGGAGQAGNGSDAGGAYWSPWADDLIRSGAGAWGVAPQAYGYAGAPGLAFGGGGSGGNAQPGVSTVYTGAGGQGVVLLVWITEPPEPPIGTGGVSADGIFRRVFSRVFGGVD